MTLKLHLKSYHAYYLNQLVFAIAKLINDLSRNYASQLYLPLHIERYTLLRSPHVDKKSREQFERITHMRVLTFKFNSNSITNTLLERVFYFIQLNAIGVEVRVECVSRL